MRKLELIAAFAMFAAATPLMAQGRGHDHDHDHGHGRGLGVGGVPPGQIVAAQHRRNDRDDDDRDGRYNPNGGSNLPNGAVVLPNGQVVYPTGTRYPNGSVYYPSRSSYPNGSVYYPSRNSYPNGSVYYPNRNAYPTGQSCGQIRDRNGNIRTVCRNDRRGDGDADDRYQAARNRTTLMRYMKARKHRDRDHDGGER